MYFSAFGVTIIPLDLNQKDFKVYQSIQEFLLDGGGKWTPRRSDGPVVCV